MKLNDGMVGLNVIVNHVEAPKAVIVINHGFAEHTGRYDWVVEKLTHHGYATVRYDVKEHGDTIGTIDSYEDFIADLRGVVLHAKTLYEGTPVYNLGHSMGGLITAMFGLVFGEEVDGQILSGAALGNLPAVSGIKGPFLKLASKLFPNAMIKNVVGDAICSDPEVVKVYNEDPKVLTHARAKFLYEFAIEGPKFLLANDQAYDCDVLLLHGEKDSIVPVQLSYDFLNNISSTDKELIVYPNLFHEILNEVNKDKVINDILNWLDKKVKEFHNEN